MPMQFPLDTFFFHSRISKAFKIATVIILCIYRKTDIVRRATIVATITCARFEEQINRTRSYNPRDIFHFSISGSN